MQCIYRTKSAWIKIDFIYFVSEHYWSFGEQLIHASQSTGGKNVFVFLMFSQSLLPL